MIRTCSFIINFSLLIIHSSVASAQVKWTNVDSLYQPLPESIHIFFTNDKIDTGNFRAYYIEADLKDKNLEFTVDTTLNRRMTPKSYYERDGQLLVISNCSFFSFQTNRNVNVLVKNGRMISFDTQLVKGRGKDSLFRFFTLRSAIGINKNREADIAWTAADSSMKFPMAYEFPEKALALSMDFKRSRNYLSNRSIKEYLKKNPGERSGNGKCKQ